MPGPTRIHASDLRGAARLAIDAGAGITDIVEHLHRTIQLGRGPLGRASTGTTRGITGFVYRSVRGGMRLVGRGVDASLAPAAALLPEGISTPARDAFLAAVNGMYGDYLARTRNPLEIGMSLRHDGRLVDPADPAASFDIPGGTTPTGNLLVMVHGLCLNDRHWTREEHNHGALLARDCGYTPLYLRYNSGQHIATNGRALAQLLESVKGNWPEPVRNLVIIGHSMGGLVARSACHHAHESGHAWPGSLRKLFFLGTPHQGAPLERGGHWLDFLMDLSPYSAPFTRIGKARSAGISDLRHGTITPGKHRHVALPRGTQCYTLAATLGSSRGLVSKRLVGDGLVPLDSALGRHPKAARSLRFPKERQWIGYGMGHLELLSRPEVYSQLRSWLQESPDA
jgi:pimeloyl-ACP methyl ester carboxylesterase